MTSTNTLIKKSRIDLRHKGRVMQMNRQTRNLVAVAITVFAFGFVALLVHASAPRFFELWAGWHQTQMPTPSLDEIGMRIVLDEVGIS